MITCAVVNQAGWRSTEPSDCRTGPRQKARGKGRQRQKTDIWEYSFEQSPMMIGPTARHIPTPNPPAGGPRKYDPADNAGMMLNQRRVLVARIAANIMVDPG